MYRLLIRVIFLPLLWILRWCHVFPKYVAAYFRKLRGNDSGIVDRFEGQLRYEGKNFATLVIWQSHEIPWYVDNLLSALAQNNVNVILTSNCVLGNELTQTLLKRCHTLLVRDNTGFDFGAYRDATLMIAKEFDPERVIYLNDSLYYFRRGLDGFVKRLINSNADLCGAFESWEKIHHVQSFAFSVSGSLFRNNSFQHFWKHYLPVSSRSWAVQKGEIALSRAMIPNAGKIDIIYGKNKVRDRFKRIDLPNIWELNNLLPKHLRLGTKEYRVRQSVLIQVMLKRMSLASPIHGGGLIYHCLLGCPIMKRDLVYRMQFDVEDVELCFQIARSDEYNEEVLSELRRKGSGKSLPILKRLLFHSGLI